MLSLAPFLDRIVDDFSFQEKLALLAALRAVYLADERYETIEQIGFQHLVDTLDLGLGSLQLAEALDAADPALVIADRAKRALVLEAMTHAAVVDGDADDKEIRAVAALAAAWGVGSAEYEACAVRQAAVALEFGLSGVLASFTAQVSRLLPPRGAAGS